jgi:hypothetical protein
MSAATASPGICQACGDEHPAVALKLRKVARCHCRGVIEFPNRERAETVASGLVVKMFMPQFAPSVERWEKLQTVRPTPKRMPKVGQRISLRAWVGKPYRSKQRILGESEITQVQSVWFNGVTLLLDDPKAERGLLSREVEDAFSRADGFENLAAMATWFKANHGEWPFIGIVIKWAKPTQNS